MFRSYIRFSQLLVTLLIFLSACNVPFIGTETPEVGKVVSEDFQVTALRQLEADSETPPGLYFQNGFPRFVSGSFVVEGKDVVERARNFLESHRDLYHIANPDLELAVRRVSEAESETDVVFYQTYKDVEVFASEIVVTLSGDRVYATMIATHSAGVVSYDDTSPNYLSHRYRVDAFNGTGATGGLTEISDGCVY